MYSFMFRTKGQDKKFASFTRSPVVGSKVNLLRFRHSTLGNFRNFAPFSASTFFWHDSQKYWLSPWSTSGFR